MNNLATHVSFRVLVAETVTVSKVSELQDEGGVSGVHTRRGDSGNSGSTDIY
jgi:hypothetical protein